MLHSTDTACNAAPASRYTPKTFTMQQICSTARRAHVRASSNRCTTAETSLRHTWKFTGQTDLCSLRWAPLFLRGLVASTACNCPRIGQPRWSRQGPGWMRRHWSRRWRPRQSSRCPPRAGAWWRCSRAAQQQSPPAGGRYSCHYLQHLYRNAECIHQNCHISRLLKGLDSAWHASMFLQVCKSPRTGE